MREVALPLGLVDNKVCAIDATWSGLRLVWRKERRAGSGSIEPAHDAGECYERNEREATAEASPFAQAPPRGKHVSLDLRVRRTVAFRRGSHILLGRGAPHTHPIASYRSPEWG